MLLRRSGQPGRVPQTRRLRRRRYELLARLLAARTEAEGGRPRSATLLKIDRIPNDKTDVNNNGAFSTDYIGGSWDYPERRLRSSATRSGRRTRTTSQASSISWRNDPQVPAALHKEMNAWGLCQGRIRRQRQLAAPALHPRSAPHGRRFRHDAEGPADRSHQARPHRHGLLQQRFAQRASASSTPDGFVRNEGDMQVAVKPYQIPYRIMLPKRGEAQQSAGAGRVSPPATWRIPRCAWSRST